MRTVKIAKLYYFPILFFIFDSGHCYDGPMVMSAGFTKYYRSEAFDRRVCLPEHVVLDIGSITTRVKCAVLCSKTELCFDIFYRPEDDKCIGCSYFLNTTTIELAGTEYYGRKGYEFIVERLNWTQAKEICTARGGYLASINSLLEKQLVDQILDKLSYVADLDTGCWIGGNDMATEGKFLWEDGTAFSDTSFSNWLEGQPDNYRNQDCTRLHKTNEKWWWNDRECSSELISLCELN